MSQKIAIFILLLVLIMTMVGIFFYWRQDQAKQVTTIAQPVIPAVVVESETPTATTTTGKRQPTEEEIQAEITTMTAQVKSAEVSGSMTSEDIKFLINPRQVVIDKLSQ